MNGTQISDTQRNNRTALTGHTIEALIVVVFYACRFIRGERSLGYFLVITALALIPVMLGQFFFFKDRETGMIKHTVGIGFAITYSFMVLTTEEANIYVLVIPMILLVSVFNDVKFSVQINIGTVILSLIMTIGGAFTGKFGYQGSDEAIVQVTAMILVAVYSIYAAQTSNANNQQKMENIKEAQSKTELLLSDISNMSQQMQSGMEDIYGKVENLNSASKLTKDAMSEVGSGTTETANAVQTQMQQKKRLADQMLTEWKDSLREKENRLFNLEEEITRQSVQSWAEHQRAEDIQALELAVQEITRISQSFYEDMQDELNAEISRYVSLFTAGAYDSVRLDEQGQLQILTEGREVRPGLLSRGTLEQIYLALRLAVGKVVTKEEPLPILLDEAFAMYDDDRLAQTLQTLSTLQNQIFLFTCQKREAEMLRKMNLDYNLIEM